jgi:DNA-binding SARP family transcriptional activator/tetratricopeptide (TPR) repeat protein
MTQFALRCLGSPRLVGPGGDEIRLRTKKNLALLTFLAVEPQVAHGRDRLAELLWPGTSTSDSRHSLATALSVLRGKLGQNVFHAGRDSVRINKTVVVTDISTLEEPQVSLDELFQLDHFLGDFAVHDAPAFCQWVDRERARTLPLLVNRISEGVAEAKGSGQAAMMLRLAEHLRRLDPLSEVAARALLEARTMLGDRIGALIEFDQWREELSTELGAVPSRSISELAGRLRKDPSVVIAPQSALSATPSVSARPGNLIGRNDVFQLCCEAWRKSANGFPEHAIVIGAPGMGKSALVERLTTLMSLEGACVIRAISHPMDRDLPYSLICKLVSQLVDLPGAAATPPPALAELSRTVPGIIERWPGLPQGSTPVGDEARVRLIDAFTSLLTTLADEGPVVLACDNVHLADSASLVVLHATLRQLLSCSIHAILTIDPTDTPPHSHVRTFLSQFDSIRGVLIELTPLSAGESEELFSSLLKVPEETSVGLRRAMILGARGNPLALVSMAAACNRDEHGVIPLASMRLDEEVASTPDMRIRSLISRLIGQLDDDTRRVAQLAALLGERLTELEYYSLLGVSAASGMRALSTLADRGILKDYDDTLVFANELVRSECYHSIEAPIRRLLHSKVADLLGSQPTKPSELDHLELAWHLVRAGRAAEATEHLLAGGRGAITKGAPHEAELALSTCLAELDAESRSSATVLLAEALQELGRWQDSLRVLGFEERAPAEPGFAQREVLRAIANRWGGNDDPEYLARTTQQLIDVARSPEPIHIRTGAIATLPYFLSHTIDRLGLSGMGEILCEVEHQQMSPYETAQIALARAWWLQRNGDWGRAAAAIQNAEQIVASEGIGSTLAVRIAIGNGLLRSLRGQYDEAIPILERAAHHAKRLENPVQIAAASASLATAYGRLGNYSCQVARSLDALAVVTSTDCSMLAIAAVYEQALGLAFEGADHEALSAAESLEIRNHTRCPAWASQAAYLMRADVLAILGDERRAQSYARKGLSISDRHPLSYDIAGPFARWFARLASEKSELPDAITIIERMTSNLAQLHAKDQAEVLAALHLLQSEAGEDTQETLSMFRPRIERLPVGVHNFLRRTGFEAELRLARPGH